MNTDPQTPPGISSTAADPSAAADLGLAPTPAKSVTSFRWRHRHGEMLIETCSDGSVWVDGAVIADTAPPGTSQPGASQQDTHLPDTSQPGQTT